jgi:hypothetical protein
VLLLGVAIPKRLVYNVLSTSEEVTL